MKSPICDMLGIEFPLLAFSHCRDVVAAVSRAGGFGVLGATAHSPESIEQELKWIDDHTDGKPYGLDVLIPENISTAGEKDVTWKSLEARISPQHRDFTRNLLKKYGIELTTTNVADNQPQPFDAQRALDVLDVSFGHPIKLIANALGVPPKEMLEMGRKHGVPVAALVGAKEHAVRQVAAGVDILVAQGTEGGGHTGSIPTSLLLRSSVYHGTCARDKPSAVIVPPNSGVSTSLTALRPRSISSPRTSCPIGKACRKRAPSTPPSATREAAYRLAMAHVELAKAEATAIGVRVPFTTRNRPTPMSASMLMMKR